MSTNGAATVLSPGHSLACALAASLTTLGWRIHTAAGEPSGPVVLTENDHGALPLGEIEAVTASRLILVGGLTCLAELAEGAARRAATAVRADLPYREVVSGVHAALSAPDLPEALRRRMHVLLSERKAEAQRFVRLTDMEAAVLVDVARGLQAATIARRKPVALATVRSQIAAILRKLEAPSQTAAVALTFRSCADPRVTGPLRLDQGFSPQSHHDQSDSGQN